MKRSSFTIGFYLSLVFLSGAAAGVFGYRYAAATPAAVKAARQTPEDWRKQYLQEMESRLKLSPEQVNHLNRILDESRDRFHAARESHDQAMNTIKEQQRDKVRAILNEQQRPVYEKLRAERELRARGNAAK